MGGPALKDGYRDIRIVGVARLVTRTLLKHVLSVSVRVCLRLPLDLHVSIRRHDMQGAGAPVEPQSDLRLNCSLRQRANNHPYHTA